MKSEHSNGEANGGAVRCFAGRHLSVVAFLFGLAVLTSAASWAADPAPLVLEAKIPLGAVSGRIDHLAVDVPGKRLFVAELGNNSVGVVDLSALKVVATLAGLSQPQGVAFVPSANVLYVSNAGNGEVSIFNGTDLTGVGRVQLGSDADNIRITAGLNQILVGYGGGAIAVLDASSRIRIADIQLKGHPESFQVDEATGRLFVNVPGAGQIAVVDLAHPEKQTSILPPAGVSSNFPMALDGTNHDVIVVFRNPSKLIAFAVADGKVAASLDVCADADDVFVDAKRQLLYVTCGQGSIDVFATASAKYVRVASVPTAAGARTSLFVPEMDRLYVAVPAGPAEPAAIWIFRPAP